MSVLIKNTTMPKNCIECPMQFGGWCYVCPPDIDERVAETVEEAVKQGKPDWCPLVEIEGDDVAPVIHGHWVNIEIAKNTIKCSNCGHIRELKHFSEIIERPKLCEMCGAVMEESEGNEND